MMSDGCMVRGQNIRQTNHIPRKNDSVMVYEEQHEIRSPKLNRVKSSMQCVIDKKSFKLKKGKKIN